MDNTHSVNTKKSLKEQFKEGMLFLAIIVAVIAFFVSAAINGFDPAELFISVAGSVAIVLAVAAVCALLVALVVWLFRRVTGN